MRFSILYLGIGQVTTIAYQLMHGFSKGEL